jgi:hypothetical protein
MTFQRFVIVNGTRTKTRFHQVCRLYNASYKIDLSWDRGFQTINGTYGIGEEVPFPQDVAGSVSDMAQHVYSAIMWSITDLLVGSFTWFIENNPSPYVSPQFGAISSAISGTSLLGSSDFDVYFEFQDEKGLYK